jgi:hypothetical protein
MRPLVSILRGRVFLKIVGDQVTALPLAAAISAPAPVMVVIMPERAGRPTIRDAVEYQIGVDAPKINLNVEGSPVVIPIPMPVSRICRNHRRRAQQQCAQTQYRHSLPNNCLHCVCIHSIRFHFRILSFAFGKCYVNRKDAVSRCIRFRSDLADEALISKFTHGEPL